MDFTERLQKAARAAGHGESQKEISNALGLNPQTVNRWFAKGGEPNASQVFHIAERFGVNAEWLKKGTGEMIEKPSSDWLSSEERTLIADFRSVAPTVRQVILGMTRAAKKAIVTIALVVPGILAMPSPADAAIFNAQAVYYVKCLLRRILRTMTTFVRFQDARISA